jgi:hypothetical protein
VKITLFLVRFEWLSRFDLAWIKSWHGPLGSRAYELTKRKYEAHRFQFGTPDGDAAVEMVARQHLEQPGCSGNLKSLSIEPIFGSLSDDRPGERLDRFDANESRCGAG